MIVYKYTRVHYLVTFQTAFTESGHVTNLSGSLNIVKHAISVVLFPSSSMYTSSFFRSFPLSSAITPRFILLQRSRDVVLLIYVSRLLPVCGKNTRGWEGRTAQGRPKGLRSGWRERKRERAGVRVAADSAWTVQG